MLTAAIVLPGLRRGPWATPVIKHKKPPAGIKEANPLLAECASHNQDQYWTVSVAAALCAEAPEAGGTECRGAPRTKVCSRDSHPLGDAA